MMGGISCRSLYHEPLAREYWITTPCENDIKVFPSGFTLFHGNALINSGKCNAFLHDHYVLRSNVRTFYAIHQVINED